MKSKNLNNEQLLVSLLNKLNESKKFNKDLTKEIYDLTNYYEVELTDEIKIEVESNYDFIDFDKDEDGEGFDVNNEEKLTIKVSYEDIWIKYSINDLIDYIDNKLEYKTEDELKEKLLQMSDDEFVEKYKDLSSSSYNIEIGYSTDEVETYEINEENLDDVVSSLIYIKENYDEDLENLKKLQKEYDRVCDVFEEIIEQKDISSLYI